jgi:hypothetical protein
MLAPTLREKDRDAERAEVETHRVNLRSELIDALFKDPARLVSIPGSSYRSEAPAFEVLVGELVDHPMAARLGQILAAAATQTADAKLQEAALRFLMDVADAHADARAGLSL